MPVAPSDIVRAFLSAMEARALDAAASHLDQGFTMTFPGGVTFGALGELTAWAQGRYHYVTKQYEGFDEAPTAGGAVVYCFGTLAGEWTDGSAFDGIRFIDRFTVAGGKLVDQKVWNDLAENPP